MRSCHACPDRFSTLFLLLSKHCSEEKSFISTRIFLYWCIYPTWLKFHAVLHTKLPRIQKTQNTVNESCGLFQICPFPIFLKNFICIFRLLKCKPALPISADNDQNFSHVIVSVDTRMCDSILHPFSQHCVFVQDYNNDDFHRAQPMIFDLTEGCEEHYVPFTVHLSKQLYGSLWTYHSRDYY